MKRGWVWWWGLGVVLILALAIPVIASDGNIEILGSVEVRMPVPSPAWEVASERNLPNCPEIKITFYEAADGSTKDDDGYPLIAWFKGSRTIPFSAVQVDTKRDNEFVAFWFDKNGDGVAEVFIKDAAEFRAWAAKNYNGDVCEIVKEVR